QASREIAVSSCGFGASRAPANDNDRRHRRNRGSSMPDTRLLVEKKPPIAVVTLNEPEKRNPFSPTLVRQMTSALEDFASDEEIVVVIFTGAGAAFSG